MSEPIAGRPSYRRALPLHEMHCAVLLEGGVSLARTPLAVAPHLHAGYELHYIDTGTMATVLPEGQTLHARGGDLMLTQPGIRHHGERNIMPASKHLWLVVDPLAGPDHAGLLPPEAAAVALHLKNAGNLVLPAKDLQPAYRTILQLLRDWDRQPTPIIAANLRCACLAFLLATSSILRHHSPTDDHSFSEPTLQAIKLIQAHLHQPQAVAQTASQVGLSTSRFHEVFLADTGETPAAYSLRLRCLRAAEQLREAPDRTIASVADGLGFDNARYFATCFKRVLGMAPSAFREATLPRTNET